MSPIFIEDRWIKGWKAIGTFLGGFKTSHSMKVLVERYGLPLHHLPTGEPVLIMSEANAWLRAFSESSSPFSLRKMTGVALRATQGDLDGVAAKSHKLKREQLDHGRVLDWGGGTNQALPFHLLPPSDPPLG